MGRPASPQIIRERNPSLNSLPSLPTGTGGRPRSVLGEDGDGEDSTEHHAKLVVLGALSGKEIARLEDGRLIELERQLSDSETLAAKTERDRRITYLTDKLALKSALLEQAEANEAEAKKHAGLEQRELQAKAAKLDELLLSRDQALEQAQSALQKANEQSQRELAEVHSKLGAMESELAAVRLRLTDGEDGWAKGKAEADTLRGQTATDLVNTNEDRVVHRLMERMQAMEAEMASRRWSAKSIESMECRNEG
jgi:hypothetical protein